MDIIKPVLSWFISMNYTAFGITFSVSSFLFFVVGVLIVSMILKAIGGSSK